MTDENKKHLSMEALLNQGRAQIKLTEQLLEKQRCFLENVETVVEETALGKYSKLAERAYEILKEKPSLTYTDWSDLGLFDSNSKKRLFTVLKSKHPDVKIKIRALNSDGRKAYTAWIDDQKFEQSERGPDYEIGEFIQKTKPTRKQLEKQFGWDNEKANEEIGRLHREEKIQFTGIYYKWVGKEGQTTPPSLPDDNSKRDRLQQQYDSI